VNLSPILWIIVEVLLGLGCKPLGVLAELEQVEVIFDKFVLAILLAPLVSSEYVNARPFYLLYKYRELIHKLA
jgi:hypothetical protein